jgi:hypothetical protein
MGKRGPTEQATQQEWLPLCLRALHGIDRSSGGRHLVTARQLIRPSTTLSPKRLSCLCVMKSIRRWASVLLRLAVAPETIGAARPIGWCIRFGAAHLRRALLVSRLLCVVATPGLSRTTGASCRSGCPSVQSPEVPHITAWPFRESSRQQSLRISRQGACRSQVKLRRLRSSERLLTTATTTRPRGPCTCTWPTNLRLAARQRTSKR